MKWDFSEKDGNLGKFDGGSKRACKEPNTSANLILPRPRPLAPIPEEALPQNLAPPDSVSDLHPISDALLAADKRSTYTKQGSIRRLAYLPPACSVLSFTMVGTSGPLIALLLT